MDNIVISGSGIVTIKNRNGEYKYYGCTDEASINKSVESEILTCGVDGTPFAKMFGGQSYTVDVTPTLLQNTFIEMQTGTEFSTGTYETLEDEKVTAVDDGAGGAEATIDGTPVDDEVWVVDLQNESYTATYSAGTVTITDGVIGDEYIVMYKESQSSVDTLDLDSEAYPANVELQIRFIAYNINENVPVADIYWVFPKASADGALDLSYAEATNSQTPVTFDILTKSGSFGKYLIVPRA